jgi:hypothetical protein
MTGVYPRRRDPQPIAQGWEVAVVVLGGALLGLGLAALCGLGIASALFGHGWVWPHSTDTAGHVIGGLLTRHPGQGLPVAQAALVPGPGPVYGCIAVCEVALIAMSVTAAVLVGRYRRPGDARGGMATRSEARQALGLSQLRAARQIIRPDLYGTGTPKRSAR